MTIKDALKFAAGIALAGLLLWWVLRGTSPEELWAQLRQASWGLLALCAALNIGHNVFRVWRWRALLTPVQPGLAFRPMFAAIMLGYATSWLVPGRIGELVRPMLLSSREKLPLGPCIGSVVADRLFDAVAVVSLFAVGAWITPLEGKAAENAALIRSASLALVVVVVVVLGLMLVAALAGNALNRWTERAPGFVRWSWRTAVSLARGAEALRSPKLALLIVVQSLLAWMTIAVGTWVGVLAVGADISLGAVMFIMPMLVLGVAVPTPGGAGSYHGAMKLGLMLFGVSQVVAISAGVLIHAVITVPVILIGFVLLWTEGISGKDMVHAAQQFKKLGHDAPPAPAGQAMESVP